MPASSLIFVVIVAIWAVYLLQHWSRRRENAAAARSVDGFTEAMRVLEKRRLVPSAELAEPRPHSYSVTPARVVRSTVDVKDAVPAGASRRSSPLVARRRSESDHAEVETMTPAPAGSDSRRGASTDPRSDTRPSGRPSRSASRPAPRPVSRTRRRLRAALLLLSLLWVPTSVVLVVLRILLWMSIPLSVLTVVVVLVWLRTEAQADRARVGDTGRRPARHPSPAEPAPVLSSDDTQVIREPHRYAAAEPATELALEPATVQAAVSAPAGPAAYDTVFDVQAGEPAAIAEPPLQAAPGTWSPVPVPKPTYAMKAKAEPRYTADGIPADVFETPEFADEAEELDDRALFARRAASQ